MFELFGMMISAVARLIAGPLDRRRISKFFASRGEQVSSIRWSPFSDGWLSSWYERFYKVEYTLKQGG